MAPPSKDALSRGALESFQLVSPFVEKNHFRPANLLSSPCNAGKSLVLLTCSQSLCNVPCSGLPAWACGGKEGFVKQCGKCVGDSQCEVGLFCCPTLRVCMHSRTDRCRKPYNVCTSQFRTRRPEYADEVTWARECEGPSLSDWMQCP